MAEFLSLKDIGAILKKRMLMIFSITVLAVGAAWVLTYYVLSPTYQSSAMLLVNRTLEVNETSAVSSLYSNEELIQTYHAIIVSPRILNQTINQLALDETTKSLKKKIVVESEGDSQVFSIRVRNQDPVMAMRIANTIAQIFQQELVEIMNINNVVILAEAEVEETPVSPIPLFNLTIAFVAGLLFSLALALLLEISDNTIKTEEDAERVIELPVLGVVTEVDLRREKLISRKELKEFKLNARREKRTVEQSAIHQKNISPEEKVLNDPL